MNNIHGVGGTKKTWQLFPEHTLQHWLTIIIVVCTYMIFKNICCTYLSFRFIFLFFLLEIIRKNADKWLLLFHHILTSFDDFHNLLITSIGSQLFYGVPTLNENTQISLSDFPAIFGNQTGQETNSMVYTWYPWYHGGHKTNIHCHPIWQLNYIHPHDCAFL